MTRSNHTTEVAHHQHTSTLPSYNGGTVTSCGFSVAEESHLFYLKWNNSKCFLRLSVWRSCWIFCFTGHKWLAELVPHTCPSALSFCACPMHCHVCELQPHFLLCFAEMLASWGKGIYETTKKTRKEKGDFLGYFCQFKSFFWFAFPLTSYFMYLLLRVKIIAYLASLIWVIWVA